MSSNQILAQENNSKKIEIGSTILVQEGTDQNSFKNGPYNYKEIIEVKEKNKQELYKAVKRWLSSLKISNDNITLDESESNFISANIPLLITKEFAMGSVTNQRVIFKADFSFKDGKIRFEANQFMYYAIVNKAVRENPFNDLRPYSKSLMKNVYEEFDKQFSQLLNSLKVALVNRDSDNW